MTIHIGDFKKTRGAIHLAKKGLEPPSRLSGTPSVPKTWCRRKLKDVAFFTDAPGEATCWTCVRAHFLRKKK